jgi:hypothetical protein
MMKRCISILFALAMMLGASVAFAAEPGDCNGDGQISRREPVKAVSPLQGRAWQQDVHANPVPVSLFPETGRSYAGRWIVTRAAEGNALGAH